MHELCAAVLYCLQILWDDSSRQYILPYKHLTKLGEVRTGRRQGLGEGGYTEGGGIEGGAGEGGLRQLCGSNCPSMPNPNDKWIALIACTMPCHTS
jgi:hypothetical protein